MQLYKNNVITIRINSILKQKFLVANGFLTISESVGNYMQTSVREFEKQYGIIPVSPNKAEKYDILTKMYGVKINDVEMDHLLSLYPKSRKDISLHDNLGDDYLYKKLIREREEKEEKRLEKAKK